MNERIGLTYWITGASSGIGQTLATRLAAEGHRVYISGRNPDTLQAIADDNPGKLLPLPCDVTDDNAMADLLQRHDIDKLDCAIFCAGTCEYIDLPALDIDKFRRVFEANYFGVVNSCRAALPALKNAASNGYKTQIIGISSMSSYVGMPRAEAYGASKAAMSYFLGSLRSDLSGKVDVTVVYPGFVKTPMTDRNDFPMPMLMPVEKAADIILKKAPRRPLSIAFPSRLDLILKFMKAFPRLWYSFAASRISRQTGEQA